MSNCSQTNTIVVQEPTGDTVCYCSTSLLKTKRPLLQVTLKLQSELEIHRSRVKK